MSDIAFRSQQLAQQGSQWAGEQEAEADRSLNRSIQQVGETVQNIPDQYHKQAMQGAERAMAPGQFAMQQLAIQRAQQQLVGDKVAISMDALRRRRIQQELLLNDQLTNSDMLLLQREEAKLRVDDLRASIEAKKTRNKAEAFDMDAAMRASIAITGKKFVPGTSGGGEWVAASPEEVASAKDYQKKTGYTRVTENPEYKRLVELAKAYPEFDERRVQLLEQAEDVAARLSGETEPRRRAPAQSKGEIEAPTIYPEVNAAIDSLRGEPFAMVGLDFKNHEVRTRLAAGLSRRAAVEAATARAKRGDNVSEEKLRRDWARKVISWLGNPETDPAQRDQVLRELGVK